ncbi:DUF397 domain-containing protein [Nonomuraea sp. NPDC048892]|uniref:DUF397 domain-containing protein n=1 Tax=Nonomuraea sp. NPDC048892 TaxID=3154624 RepID=UPI0033E8F545
MNVSNLAWRISTFSGNGQSCVEVAPAAESVLVRHSKNPAAGLLSYSYPEWNTLIVGARGERCPFAEVSSSAVVLTDSGHRSIAYTPTEWRAFVRGVTANEFSFRREEI